MMVACITYTVLGGSLCSEVFSPSRGSPPVSAIAHFVPFGTRIPKRCRPFLTLNGLTAFTVAYHNTLLYNALHLGDFEEAGGWDLPCDRR
jgi:hypothetical protein